MDDPESPKAVKCRLCNRLPKIIKTAQLKPPFNWEAQCGCGGYEYGLDRAGLIKKWNRKHARFENVHRSKNSD